VAAAAPAPTASRLVAPPVTNTARSTSNDSRERRDKLRERLKAATAKVEPSQPTPQSPAEARSSALSLIAQLRQELEDAQKLNVAMTKDLDQARADLARAAEEARARTSEATRMASEVAERARLIEELGKEMSSLEGERDDTLVELQSVRAQMQQQQTARQDLEERLAAREAELAETLTEEERLAADLESRNVELRQAQAALAGITEERDRLSRQVADLTRERADLLDSQKALDEIHRALAEARVRVGAKS
jgi:DNA repair exonuclease SbcCD ATPase subunit